MMDALANLLVAAGLNRSRPAKRQQALEHIDRLYEQAMAKLSALEQKANVRL